MMRRTEPLQYKKLIFFSFTVTWKPLKWLLVFTVYIDLDEKLAILIDKV